MTVNQNTAFADIIKSWYQINQRCLSSAAHSYKRDNLTGFNGKIYIFQYRYFFIAERNVLNIDAAINGWKIDGAGLIFNIRSEVNDAENTVCAGNALIDGVIDIGEPFNRFVKHQQRGNKREESAGSGMTLNNIIAAVKNDGGYSQSAQKIH